MNSCNNAPDVLVALSGGMDSAAAVLLLRQAGYRPSALFLDLFDDPTERERVVALADRMGVELTVESVGERFRDEVVEWTLRMHRRGETPVPCSRCNPRLKWAALEEAADRMGIRHLATGHYVRVVERSGRHFFARGIDPAKDQSYYLWGVPERLIARAITPLGDWSKALLRDYLHDAGYGDLARRAESMSLCFLHGESYPEFLKRRLNPATGQVVDARGAVVGRHDGYPLYTIGQKRGFESAVAGAVVAVDARRNRLVVSDRPEALERSEVTLRNWQAVDPEGLLQADLRAMVRGIGRNPQGRCRVELRGDRLVLHFEGEPAWAIAPGQSVALYDGECLAGGGIISAERLE